jgi:GNAT superfamily N-acetyltransferase
MSPPDVVPVETPRDRDAFVALPYDLHRHDPGWTPLLRRDVRILLDPRKNPFFDHAFARLFLARGPRGVVGRIAAIHDRLHEETHGDRTGFFGFFESVDDPEVAGALFEAASSWLRGRQRTALRGPLSPSINDEAGLLVEGFETPSVLMMPHNPRYYAALVEGAGFRKVKDLLAFQNVRRSLPERLLRATDIAEARYGVRCRPIDMKRFGPEVEGIKALFNLAWERNWGYVPLTDREVAHLATQLKPIVVPELVLFAERAGEAIGFAAAVPDLNVALRANRSGRLFPGILKVLWASRRIGRARVLLLGVRPEWRGRGIDALLYRKIWENANRRGIFWGEASWVLEDNHAMINGLTRMGFEVYKTYRIYERPI